MLGDGYVDVLVYHVGSDEFDRLCHRLISGKVDFFLVLAEKISEIVDGLGHVQDDDHDPFNLMIQFSLRQILAFGQPLDNETDQIERLTPLVGYVVDHFSDGRQSILLDESLVLLA